METSDSEPDVKRPKIFEYGDIDLPMVDIETDSPFFTMGDYIFSSDESISGRLADLREVEDIETRNDCSEASSPRSVNDNDSRNNSSPSPSHDILSSGDDAKNNKPDETKDNSDSNVSIASQPTETRQSSWSDGTIDFESDKESSEDFVLSPFSASPNIEINDYSSNSTDSDRMYDVEFEVASVSENNDNPIEDANSSSGVDEPVNLDMPRYERENIEGDRDTDNFADGEIQLSEADSDSKRKTSRLNTSDSELSDKDKWFCNQCNARSQPYFRYCLRCFRIRRNWLPKRTKPRKAKRKKAAKREAEGTEVDSEPVPSTSRDSSAVAKVETRSDTPKPPASDESSSERMMQSFLKNLVTVPPEDNDTDTVDGPIKPRETIVRALKNADILTPPSSNPHSNQEVDSQSCSSSNKPLVNVIEPPESPLSPPLSQQSLLPRNQYPSSSQASLHGKNGINTKFLQSLKSAVDDPEIPVTSKDENHSNVPMCNLCCVREKDAAFVHNKIAHHFCCFVCADKILKKNGKCPICRDRVFRVVKIISV